MAQKNPKNMIQTIAQLIILLLTLAAFVILYYSQPAHAEGLAELDDVPVILDDPSCFEEEELDELPVISSVGKTRVKVNGVKSKGKLLKYTIPEQLLKDDPSFLALMVEAEKYIGYPYVYGAGSPDIGFDCSGFVCWVFTHSGVRPISRLGANGLYSICEDVPREEAMPGDLVFFEKTTGSKEKGITHVGIYVGNNMMIHAGDPVGFADLKSAAWARKIYAFGRLPKN